MDSQPRVVKSQSRVANNIPWSYYIIPARHSHSKVLPDERSAFGLLSRSLLAYSYHCDWNRRSLHVIRSRFENFKTCERTFGKTNLTSSNFPLRLQFSATGDLRVSGPLFRSCTEGSRLLTILLRFCLDQLQPLSFRFRKMYLSPRPCAHITVAVCLFKAGTTRGEGPGIVDYFGTTFNID